MKELLKERGILSLKSKIRGKRLVIECTGALAGNIHYNERGKVILIESLGGARIKDALEDLSDILRSSLSEMTPNRQLFVSVNKKGFIEASYDSMLYEAATLKARFIDGEEVEGTSETLMDFIIFINFL